jgi:hypothetical protein
VRRRRRRRRKEYVSKPSRSHDKANNLLKKIE